MKVKFTNHIIIIAYCLIISSHCCRQRAAKIFFPRTKLSISSSSLISFSLVTKMLLSFFLSFIHLFRMIHTCSKGKDMRKKSCMIKINRNYTQQRERGKNRYHGTIMHTLLCSIATSFMLLLLFYRWLMPFVHVEIAVCNCNCTKIVNPTTAASFI